MLKSKLIANLYYSYELLRQCGIILFIHFHSYSTSWQLTLTSTFTSDNTDLFIGATIAIVQASKLIASLYYSYGCSYKQICIVTGKC
jgi:hypothetical protein